MEFDLATAKTDGTIGQDYKNQLGSRSNEKQQTDEPNKHILSAVLKWWFKSGTEENFNCIKQWKE